jgi:hypothetical protein
MATYDRQIDEEIPLPKSSSDRHLGHGAKDNCSGFLCDFNVLGLI